MSAVQAHAIHKVPDGALGCPILSINVAFGTVIYALCIKNLNFPRTHTSHVVATRAKGRILPPISTCLHQQHSEIPKKGKGIKLCREFGFTPGMCAPIYGRIVQNLSVPVRPGQKPFSSRGPELRGEECEVTE